MKHSTATLLTFLFFTSAFGQKLISGAYDSGLKLSYDSVTKKITGYFEEYTGIDETTNNPRFACVFYIEGIAAGQKFPVNTYYPTSKNEDLIQGTMEIVSNNHVKIKLPKEHGGCWNVQPFTGESVDFTLEKNRKWVQIRYADTPRAYFYSDKSDDKRLKSYIVKGNFVCIQKIEGDWAYCFYFGKKISEGWVKLSDLNEL